MSAQFFEVLVHLHKSKVPLEVSFPSTLTSREMIHFKLHSKSPKYNPELLGLTTGKSESFLKATKFFQPLTFEQITELN